LGDLQIDLSKIPFNLEATLCCGQVFRWERASKTWYGVIGEMMVQIKQDHHDLLFQTHPQDFSSSFIQRYFRFQDDLPKILTNIDQDPLIHVAINALFGLRLIRQEPWECLISYLCATYANISRIKDMLERLSRRFGKKLHFKGKTFYSFPTRKALAQATVKDLLKCNLGYRAPYILNTAKLVNSTQFDLAALAQLPYVEGRRYLLTLKGVGPKVADCVLLFSQNKLEAFPVDVWIKRIVTAYAPYRDTSRELHLTDGQNLKNRQIAEFGRQYFGRYAGYAQEYLYSYYRGRMRNAVNNRSI
jgi:N-glycosylase/DNA lyase